MSGPTPTGNSCSLENCYTNLFALTDICGIKWRKLCIDPIQTQIDPFEDPVLSSYSKCIQADILCVWRRVEKSSEMRPHDVSFGKELWIFWYGDQPSVLDDILPPALKEHEYGSWEKDNALSYDCRTLLFKALHNLIERCLVAKNFVRIGKWFVQPYDPSSGLDQTNNLSFCFNFFLHGESTVCASIEVKQHPPVTYLCTQHMNHIQESGTQLNVLLAPYGMNGSLTGVTYRDSDHTTRKHLDEWRQFFPARGEEGRENDPNRLPGLVEVVVAGVRMKYPSCYVLLVDDPTQRGQEARNQGNHGQPMSHEEGLQAGMMNEMKGPTAGLQQRILEPVSEITSRTSKLCSQKLVERVCQDTCVTSGLVKRSTENMLEDTVLGTWDFGDPSSKSSCNCQRLRNAKNKTGPGNLSKQLEKKKGDKSLERQQSRLLRTIPFHRRNAFMEEYLQFDMFVAQMPTGTGCNSNSGGSAGNQSASGSQPPVSAGSTPTPSTGGSGSGAASTETVANVSGVSMESPASNAPSPLEDSHTHSQLDNTSSMDPMMPTLSPHPPLIKPGDKDVPQGGGAKTLPGDASLSIGHGASVAPNANNSNSSIGGVMVNGVGGENNNVFHKPGSGSVLKMENVTLTSSSWCGPVMERSKSSVNSWLRSQQRQVDHKLFKRPCLPSQDCDTDELVTDSLYNFDSVNTWSDYPLKKQRYERGDQLNGMHDLRSQPNSGQNHRPAKPATPQPPAPDPYAFSDESSSTPATISRSMSNSRMDIFQRQQSFKEEEKMDTSNGPDAFSIRNDKTTMDFGSLTSPPTTPGTQIGGSLTREVDLIPQESDLDNLFETDSDSNDDAFVAQSPICPKSVEDIKCTKLPNTGPADIIAPSELARMYPTPPSLENNPALSPMTSVESLHDTGGHTSSIIESICIPSIKTECAVGSLMEELSREGNWVYKPDTRAQFPSSAKYAPVELYSAQLSPPPEVPEYKPWQFNMPLDKQNTHMSSQYINLPSIENLQTTPSRNPFSAIEASPATTFQNSVGQQRTPMSYELQSPASNASSYLNKTPNSNLNHNLGTNHQIPEANSLLVNLVLSDSLLNLFKDQNFDSCNICVCNMTIKGSDVGVYLPSTPGDQEDMCKCTCGFSAVVNKRCGHFAGLFYEDEVDITGLRDERFEIRKPSLLSIDCNKVDESGNKVGKVEEMPQSLLQLLMTQFTVPYPTCSIKTLSDKLLQRAVTFPASSVNMVQLQDGNEAAFFALDQGRQAMEHCQPNKPEDSQLKKTCLHNWTYLQGASQVPTNMMEVMHLLKGLQPILQDAIQNKRVTRLWEHTYKLQGPLTWIEFHQLAGRGTDENCEPQPIPSLLVGLEKDSATVSPYALRYWDKNILEPYGRRRDIAYVVVTPENDYSLGQVGAFFKELSTVYEWCRLGRHCPVSDKIRDGILRVGRKSAQKLGEQEVDDWFKFIGESHVAAKLRLYAQLCRHHLAPFLAQLTDFKTLFTNNNTSSQKMSQPKPQENLNSENLSNSQGDDKDGSSGVGGESSQRETHDDMPDDNECPAIVIYIVNPFTYGQEWDDLSRLAMNGLLRCYQEILPKLPEVMQNNIYLQIIPLQTILDHQESGTRFQMMKNIAFSVHTSCRWNLTHSVLGRSLTGFGPAAAAEILMKKRDSAGEHSHLNFPFKLYSPAFVLAPIKDKQEQLAESCSEKRENSTILMVVYCLSEDQRWLLACCTDDRGEMLETCTINIEIPNRNRRKKTSARKIGLGKLWDFILGVISLSSKPCRVVIGRFGRMGHGELKGWSGLLSKRNIQRCSRKMRDLCSQCSVLPDGEFPFIVSACLTSFEQQTSFTLMHDCVNPEEKQGTNCPLQTPKDASCSHILVFPTSATAQANSHQAQLDSNGEIDLGGHNLEFGVDLSDTNIINDFENTTDDFGSLMDVFVSITNSPQGSPRQDNTDLLDMGRNSPKLNGGGGANNSGGQLSDPQEDPVINLLNQPLAMGYYISTAPTGPLPRWFWSACPENELAPVKTFKSALHIHVSTNQDDFMHQSSSRNSHPLDSNLTCDVLRFVLEKYNALSWLTYDPATNDRQSCLPLHFSVLMQMYHAINAYV